MPSLPPPPIGIISDTKGFPAPIWLNWFNAVYKGASSGLVINVQSYGARGDGITDDTTAINTAILAAFNGGGGVVYFPPGVYLATQIIIYRTVLLDGGFVGGVELKLKDNTDGDFIISENFASLTGTGKYYPVNPEVPYFFGLKDMRINGNKANNSSGRGIAWYGNAQFMYGTIDVYDCPEDNIYTEASNNAAITTWQTQEEGYFDTVISRTSGGKGWLFRGPHDSRINTYNCILGADGDYGWYSEEGTHYSGATDKIGQLHVYSSSSNTTNRQGIYLGAAIIADFVFADGVSMISNVPGGHGFTLITTVLLGNVGLYTNFNGFTIQDQLLSVNRIIAAISPGTTGCKVVNITGSNNQIGSVQIFGADVASCTGIKDVGTNNQISEMFIDHMNNTGCIGLDLNSINGRYEGIIQNCKIAFKYTAGLLNVVNLTIFTAAGESAVSGSPTSTDRFNIVSSGAVTGATQKGAISSGFAIDSTGAKSVTIAHGLLYTPVVQNVSLTLEKDTNVSDFTLGFMRVDSTDATNINCTVLVATASGTAAATAKLMAYSRTY